MSTDTFHVGCGAHHIYGGVTNRSGTVWKEKKDVTADALAAVAQYLVTNDDVFYFVFEGQHYVLRTIKRKERK